MSDESRETQGSGEYATLPGTNLPLLGVLNLAVLYIVWGSTYLAIRVAVREGSGIEPFALGAIRLAPASLLLLAFAALRRGRIRPRKSELVTLAISGLLLWVGGNGLVNWGEQRADSSYAALLIGTMPLWVAVMEAALDRRRPGWRLVSGLLLGFAGVAVLTWPRLQVAEGADVLSVLALLGAPLSWSAGSVLLARRPVQMGPAAISGWQQVVGAVGFLAIALLAGESVPDPTPEAWGAYLYLLVFGSLIAFTSFMAALRLLPTSLVMTYPYVNPVIAVILGHLLLDEPLDGYVVAGTVLVLLGVAGVFEEKRRRGRRRPAVR